MIHNKRIVSKGDRFNDWTVIREVEKRNEQRVFLCQNSKEIQREVRLGHMVSGLSKGKFNRYTKHKMSKTRIWNIWQGMKWRCLNKNEPAYKYYGKRGVKVCNRWLKFENFYDDMKEGYDDTLTIERIDVNGNYCKGNCTWIPQSEQSHNLRRHATIEYKGRVWKVYELAKKFGIKYHTLYGRLFTYNIPVEDAISAKMLHNYHNKQFLNEVL